MSQQAEDPESGPTTSQVAPAMTDQAAIPRRGPSRSQVASEVRSESQQVASQVQGGSQAVKREDDPAYVNLVVKQQVRMRR